MTGPTAALATTALILAAAGAALRAQDAAPKQAPGPGQLKVWSGFNRLQHVGDYSELPLVGGLFLQWRDIEVRAQRGILHLDRETTLEGIDNLRNSSQGLPRRGPGVPPDKRLLGPEILSERLQSFLAAAGVDDPATQQAFSGPSGSFPLRLFRNLYVEGGVSVVRQGVEVIRAERLTLSPVDDRAVMEDVVLRLVSQPGKAPANPSGPPIAGQTQIYTIRGARIVKQGPRYVGRDLSVTTSVAGKPHFEVFSGEVEIVEAGSQFIIRSRSNSLAIGGVSILPLPNVSLRTGEQNQFFVQGASGGYSSVEGPTARVDLGAPFNDVGGAIHSWLTGRNGDEFRGDWMARLSWIDSRGFPLGAGLTWRGGDIYEGQIEAFHLDDEGINIRDISTYLDGDPIADAGRNMIRGRNRLHFSEDTKLDLYGDFSSDPAVLSEFYRRDYREDEIPETGFDLRSRHDNLYLRAGGRWNLSGFTYDDSRALTPRFVERVPFARATLFSEPIAETPWETPILFTAASEVGQWRSNYDDTFVGMRPDDRTLRLDQRVEIAAPMHLGGIGIRPYAEARYTFFDNTPGLAGGGNDSNEDRWAFEAGVRLGTRLQRSWSWLQANGDRTALRHVILPQVTLANRWQVSGDPGDFYQFDEVDALDENASIRVGALNVLQGTSEGPDGERVVENVLWLDVEQEITPISDRDNMGHHLGLLEYEFIVRPNFWWSPVPNLRLLIEGEHDWNEDRANTFNTALHFGPVVGLSPYVEYRTDHATSGSVLYGASTNILGRWSLSGGSQYDLELDEVSFYNASIIRRDLDWSLSLSATFDNISGDTTFRILFEPSLGGMFRGPAPRQFGNRALYGGGDPTVF